MKTTNNSKLSRLLIFASILLIGYFSNPLSGISQYATGGLKSITEVDSLFIGWENDPDTLVVYVDTSYSQAEKDSIQKAMDRWNGTGHRPQLRMWNGSEPTAQIFFKTNPALGSVGLCETRYTNFNGKQIYKSSTISRKTKTGGTIGLTELATHELGHALGLNDTDETANPSDAMKAAGSNGKYGKLSKHDSSEIQVADADWIKNKLKKAALPDTATVPGSVVTVSFELGETYPPAVANQAVILVSPEFNEYIWPSATAHIAGNELWSELTLDPLHWSAAWYVYYGVDLPDPYEDFYFIGWHYAHIDPVPPTFFDIFFDITITPSRGGITVDWTTSYPYQTSLRSVLYVDDTIKYLSKGGGPYVLNLEEGNHVLTLYVDDYKNNFSSVTTNINVGQPENEGVTKFITAWPNPFTEFCKISCSEVSDIEITDLQGKVVWETKGEVVTWKPSAGVAPGFYMVRVDSPHNSDVLKIIYLPHH